MAISRERKVVVAVLLVAGAGLAVDRGFMGVSGPTPAHASEISPVPATEPSTRKAPSPTNQTFTTLSARLKKLGEVQMDNDLLASTLQREPAEEPKAVFPERVVEDGRRQFIASHHLSAIATTTRGSNALVNGRAVLIGESIDGYRLIEVTRAGAVFEGPEGRVELPLPASR